MGSSYDNDNNNNNNNFFSLSLQELLTKHKMLCAEFLEQNYDRVFSHYENLLNSENYVTRRQSLKLLGELLLDRHNFSVSFMFKCFFFSSLFIIVVVVVVVIELL